MSRNRTSITSTKDADPEEAATEDTDPGSDNLDFAKHRNADAHEDLLLALGEILERMTSMGGDE